MNYIEMHITEACNLNCRGCSNFSVFAKPKHKDIEEFERELTRLAEIMGIGMIRLLGGEPLLNPRFMEYALIARRLFPKSRVILVTNGLLLKRLVPHIDTLREKRIEVTMSNYRIKEQNMELFRSLPYTELHEKGSLYNISLDLEGKQDEAESFRNCDIATHGWYYFADGRIFPCCIAGTITDFWDHFGLDFGLDQKSFGIDIFTHTEQEIEEFLSRPIGLCRFCDTRTRPRTYRPFERTKGDIKEWLI